MGHAFGTQSSVWNLVCGFTKKIKVKQGRRSASKSTDSIAYKEKRPSRLMPGRLREKENYFLSSFLGLHFSQTFLALAASWQHLCSHSLPAFLALSQQLSARALRGAARSARVQAIIVNNLMLFISVL